jgi:hypothetical protein
VAASPLLFIDGHLQTNYEQIANPFFLYLPWKQLFGENLWVVVFLTERLFCLHISQYNAMRENGRIKISAAINAIYFSC